MRYKFHSTRIHSRWLCHSNFDFHWKWLMNFRMFPFFPSLHLTTLFGCCDIVTSIFYISFTSFHPFILDSPWNLIWFIRFPCFLRVFQSSIFAIFSPWFWSTSVTVDYYFVNVYSIHQLTISLDVLMVLLLYDMVDWYQGRSPPIFVTLILRISFLISPFIFSF